ncbi:hypothetical protein LIER_01680 [Lithospermum erythrorhizon]|uniref:Uncharacterized protein n=1 Tax=Lithospermum erythrorhizon TaxID=34254 RepID=A0AAV3NN03_LITER
MVKILMISIFTIGRSIFILARGRGLVHRRRRGFNGAEGKKLLGSKWSCRSEEKETRSEEGAPAGAANSVNFRDGDRGWGVLKEEKCWRIILILLVIK